MLYLLTILGLAWAQAPATREQVRSIFKAKIDECKGHDFYLSYDEPDPEDDDTLDKFEHDYHDIMRHNGDANKKYTRKVNCLTTVALQLGQEVVTPEANEVEMIGNGNTGDSPDNYDRRDDDTTTDARNQGSCGSCWAFSGIAALESAYLILTGDNPSDVDFSEQQFLDCTYEDSAGKDGCNGGWMTYSWKRLESEEKSILLNETQRPYTRIDGTCDILEMNKPNAMKKVIMSNPSYRQVGDSSSADIMGAATQDRIYDTGAVSIAIMTEDAFNSYSAGVYDTPCADTASVNHALTLIGYSQSYFIAQNSWGTWWGENGHVKLSRTDGNLCQMLSYTMWPLMECSWGVDTETGKCRTTDNCGGCENNGRCVFDRTGLPYKCECLDGYTGDKCQTKEDKCTDVECENGGECDVDTGKCDCEDGWTGDSCEEEQEDKCANVVCETGETCNTKTGECESNTCTKKCNGAKSECYWKGDKMKCRCPGMTYGKGCTKEATCSDAKDSTEKGQKWCEKKFGKDEAKFNKKCQKTWGKKKCPILCGYCAAP